MDLEFSPSRLLLMGFLLGATQASAMEETRMVKKVSGTDLDLGETKDFTKQNKTLEMYAQKASAGKPLFLWKIGTTGNPAVYLASGKDKEKRAELDKLLAKSESQIDRLSCYTLVAPAGEFVRDDQATAQMNLRVARAYLDTIKSAQVQQPEVVNAVLALVARLHTDQALKNAVAPDLARLQSELADLQGSDAITGHAAEFLGNAINSDQLNSAEKALAQYKLALLRVKGNELESAIELLSAAIKSGYLDAGIVPAAVRECTAAKRELTVAKYNLALAQATRLYGDPDGADPRVGENKQRALFEDVLIAGDRVQPDQLAVAKYYLAGLCLKAENKDVNRARELFKAAIESGTLDPDKLADAQLQLAVLYAGAGDAQLQPVARGLFDRVIAGGHANVVQLVLAQYNLADMYDIGRGGEKDDTKARELFEAALIGSHLSREEQADAEYKLATLCLDGRGGAVDAVHARDLFKSALDSNKLHPILKAIAQYQLASFYAKDPANAQNDAQARRLFKEAIESRLIPTHLTEAKYKLANLLKDGRGGAPDLATMRRLYEEVVVDGQGLSAAERVNAMYSLARMYARSQGGDQNTEQAVALLERAIDSGLLTPEALASAQGTISMLVDPEQKAELAELAAWENLEAVIRSTFTFDQDRALAQYNLAMRYNRGTPGGRTNKRGAAELYEAAIHSGFLKVNTQAHAEYELAILFAEGRGVDQNGERATQLLKRALASETLNQEQKADAQRWISNLKSCIIL